MAAGCAATDIRLDGNEISEENGKVGMQALIPELKTVSLGSPMKSRKEFPSHRFTKTEIHPSEIEFGSILGEGAFGRVYRAKCRHLDVAVKVLVKVRLPEKEMSAFRAEVSILSKISHPHVIALYGACTEPGHLMLVTELMDTSLDQLLFDKKVHLSLYDQLRIAYEVTLGMLWLHACHPPIVHRDLKTSNILVKHHPDRMTPFTIKICDFGLSQVKHSSGLTRDSSGPVGTFYYMAPECLRGCGWDERSDVYSFAMVLWEIYMKQYSFPDDVDLNSFSVVYDFVVERRQRPSFPDDIPTSLKHLIQACWCDKAQDRLSFSQVMKELQQVIMKCCLPDPLAIELWQQMLCKNFIESPIRFEVPWTEFWTALSDFISSRSIGDDRARQNVMTLLHVSNRGPSTSTLTSKKMVTLQAFSQLIHWFGGLAPTMTDRVDIVGRIGKICSFPWFHGRLDRARAVQMLASQPAGTFLIRLSEVPLGGFSISQTISRATAQDPPKVRHVRICRKGDGFGLSGKIYASLPELVAANQDRLKFACPGTPFEQISVGGYDADLD